MNKILNFDMDGTIVNFYGVENWLQYLLDENSHPYVVATPLINLSLLARLLNRLQKFGYEINIISWLSKNSTEDFDKEVTNAKLQWLKKHLPSVKFDNIYILSYGTPKYKYSSGILFDDELKNREEWGKNAYCENEIFKILKDLCKTN